MATLHINGTKKEISEVLKIMSNHFDIEIKDETINVSSSNHSNHSDWEFDSFVSEMINGAYND